MAYRAILLRRAWRLILVLVCLLLATCTRPLSLLEQIRSSGVLRVVMRDSPTVYRPTPDGARGFDYDLLRGFADSLGVALDIQIASRFTDILPAVSNGRAHLAAAGLSVTPERRRQVRFAPTVLEVTPQIVYLRGRRRPRNIMDVVGSNLEVVAGSSHAERLEALRADLPALSWLAIPDTDDEEELLARVASGELENTVADSNLIAVARRYHPQLAVAFNLGRPDPLAWAFPLGEDNSLYNQAVAWLVQARRNGQIADLRERYFGHLHSLDYPGAFTLKQRMRSALPQFRAWFEEAGRATGMDWRLLAAVGYQESLWIADARSPTGVRGLMMLTRRTAKEVGVENRLDPQQSIAGGARYLAALLRRIDEDVREPDRSWFMLAAYNVGLGHLRDARALARSEGRDDTRWLVVREYLRRLNDPEWSKRTHFGRALGREAVEYVENIRSYYDVLLWHGRQEEQAETARDAPPPPYQQTLNLNAPVL